MIPHARLAFFDFASHLYHHTGVKSWDVEGLTGGAANFTVRVRRGGLPNDNVNDDNEFEPVNRDDYSAIFNAHPTVVIKQAPAVFAQAPDIPFSPYRQVLISFPSQYFTILNSSWSHRQSKRELFSSSMHPLLERARSVCPTSSRRTRR